jgi:holo-[acyl-carrier protein] synthase
MIAGVGVDIIEIERIKRVVDFWGSQFLDKVFTDREIRYCFSMKNSYQHLAGRFAAKEAISKAISTGWSGIFRWKDVEILNDENGKPNVHLHNKLRDKFNPSKLHISISHSRNYVVALAVLEI